MKIKSALLGLAVGGSVAVAGTMLVPSAAQSAVNYFNETKIVTSTSGTATCPSGWKVTGGGYKIPADYFGSVSSSEYKVTSSAPTSTGWKATAKVIDGQLITSSGWQYSHRNATPTAYAVCTR